MLQTIISLASMHMSFPSIYSGKLRISTRVTLNLWFSHTGWGWVGGVGLSILEKISDDLFLHMGEGLVPEAPLYKSATVGVLAIQTCYSTYSLYSLRWGSPENPMKSAYLVEQGYANICKMVSIVIIHVPIYRDASNCYHYQFLEICISLCNDPIGLIQKGHLK